MSLVLPTADERTVAAYAHKLVAANRERVLVLAADPEYAGAPTVTVDDVEVRVRGCVSSLAVREALLGLGDGFAILLTDRSAEDLGDSLVARFRRQRIEPLDAWATVPGLFRASHLDVGLRHEMPWLPALLHEQMPPGGWPPSPTDVLTRDHALGAVAGRVLRLPADEIGLGALLDRLGELAVRADWSALPEPARESLSAWAGLRAGRAAAALLDLAAAPGTAHVHVAAMGLVFDVLYGPGAAAPGVAEARRGWESGYRLPRVPAEAAALIGSAARARVRLLGDTDPAARHPIWRDTPEAFAIATLPDGAGLSLSHPQGYRARLEALALALADALADLDDARGRGGLESALADLRAHDLAWADQQEGTERAEMSVRLVRWLASGQPDAPATLGQALTRQVSVDGWVDRATADVWSGSTDEVLARSYARLCQRILQVRRAHDEQVAGLLAQATSRAVLDPDVLPVERFLADVVGPLRRVAPVLLVVVDGMSAAVALAVADGVSRLAWTEHVPAESGGVRGSVLAALPTMTRYSRTSLLCGALREGTQVEEKREFARITGGPVFHKDDLRAPAGAAVNPEVAAAIRSDQPVVAVVLNTVDDTLAKHDPDGTRWSVSAIQHLENLLDLARQHGRTVVLSADHGHVVERGGRADLRELADARWRPSSTGPAVQGEIALAGPRVLAAGGSIVAAWIEDLRYGRKAAGYHGGASAAEVTIPLLVFAAGDLDLSPAGWVPAGEQAPAWWHAGEPVRGSAPRAAVRPAGPSTTRRKAAAPVGDTLFDLPPEPVPANTVGPAPAGDPHGAALRAFEASPTHQRMRAAAGRGAPSQAAVTALLGRLLAGGGRASLDQVSGILGVSPARAGLAMAGVRRLLNVEGYAVISMDADGRTVLLDEALWRQQFGIDR